MFEALITWIALCITVFQLCGGQEGYNNDQGRWQDNIRPKLFAHLSSRDYQSFSGVLLNDPKTGRNLSSRQNTNILR